MSSTAGATLTLLIAIVSVVVLGNSVLMTISDLETGPEVEAEWDVDGLPVEKAKLVVRETQIEGYEHGFYFCDDGRHGPVVQGGRDSITDHDVVSIDCGAARTGFFHVHPNWEGHDDLSFGDRGTGDDEGWWANCVSNLRGSVYCEVQRGNGTAQMRTTIDVGDRYSGDVGRLREVTPGG